MSNRYLAELNTPSVQAAQERYGSRRSMDRLISHFHTDNVLTPQELEFIAERDGFYMATISESGWPYLQYRGGPPGFLRAINEPSAPGRLAWADFRGNRQYISVGNLNAAPRVSLFLMDYATQSRLKILGTAKVFDARSDDEGMELARRLASSHYDAQIERAITVDVHSYDWNCPRHITPRWTEAELSAALDPLRAELADLRDENRELKGLL